jgi:CRISPR-associated protein Csb2
LREKLDGVTRLWTGDRDADGESGRKEWRLALEGFGAPEDFSDASRLFGAATDWESATVFLAAGALDRRGPAREVRRLLVRRGIVSAEVAARVEVEPVESLSIGGAPRRAIHFHRFRVRGREAQPDAAGALLRLRFPEPIAGPLALGYGCHFGLGMFRRAGVA